MSKKAIIAGAGPAGLTAAYELLQKTDIHPEVHEATDVIGGISQTVRYNGNRMDIGGHRFFSKNEQVMDWWMKMMPVQGARSKDDILLDLNDKELSKGGPDPVDVEGFEKYMERYKTGLAVERSAIEAIR